jgi:nucleoside-diphosphate-sugar epimerase
MRVLVAGAGGAAGLWSFLHVADAASAAVAALEGKAGIYNIDLAVRQTNLF